MRIVVDAMGGDHAPGVVVAGAVRAARDFGVDIILVGKEDIVKAELAKHPTTGLPIRVLHASQIIEMHEHTLAVKEKKDNSMSVGMRLLKQGEADAFVTAGNTGGALAAALFTLGRIRGIHRPALCSIFPASASPAVLIDLGANTDPKPEQLAQNALMGSLYAEHVLGIHRPRVGIVSNGEEEDKGSMLVRDAFKLLKDGTLNFVGNLEGRDIPGGKADVIVTDGFTGNVIIKYTEGIVSFLVKFLRRQVTAGPLAKIALVVMIPGLILLLPGLILLLPNLRRLRRRVDHRELGAALLAGVEGNVLVGHGSADALAVRNAVRTAIRVVEGRIVERIKAGLKTVPSSPPAPVATPLN
ncbi:MAG TPA: phosphate acyltransferase PlsX [Anaerolineae bacterium]|nr:phosphate acyltransferase PlsX [Anaerolineae bacterium]